MKALFGLTLKSATRDTFLMFWSLILPIGGCLALGFLIKTPDYPEQIMIGMAVFSVLSYAFMTTAYVNMAQRKRGVFNLLRITPMELWKYVVSVGSAWMLIATACGMLVIAVCVPVFQMKYPLLAILACAPVMVTAAIGYVFFSFFISSLVKTEAHMSMATNLVSLPLLFLCDAFYSLDGAPAFLQTISRFNPLGWFIGGLHTALLLDVSRYFANMGLLLLVLIVALFLAVRAFRHSDT